MNRKRETSLVFRSFNKEVTSYDWDITYIDAPLVRFRDVNGDGLFNAAGETVYFTWDANHNITALVDAAASGVVERYVYAPYGGATKGEMGAGLISRRGNNSPTATRRSCGGQGRGSAMLKHARLIDRRKKWIRETLSGYGVTSRL